MVHVLATIELQSGRRAEFLKEFRAVQPLVQAEDGCVEYVATIDKETDISVQGPLRPDCVVIVEKWRDLPALKKHLGAPHMADYRVRIRPFVARVSLQVLEPA